MSLRNWLYRITKHKPMRLIEVGGKPYLERYFMGTWGGRQIWLHRFLRDDAEKHVHSHPWAALSFILTGGYTEEIAHKGLKPDDVRGRYRLTFNYTYLEHCAPGLNFIGANHRHRIVQVLPGTWSLMVVGKRHGKGWAFFSENKYGVQSELQPETTNDWHLRAKTRREVYADRGVHEGILREASACAFEIDEA